MRQPAKVPARAWLVVAAGTAVNLCLGILYAWSVWKGGLVAGLVVGGYGGAAIYISPLAGYLIAGHGLSGSFITLGVLFAVVVVAAGRLLSWPPAGYVPPAPPAPTGGPVTKTLADWPPR